MAILWTQQRDGQNLEVRSAGHTRRLYVDGVLHTQHNPTRPLTGDVWDPIGLSALFAPPSAIKRVLLLGLGGGAVIHLLRRFVAPITIVAVELDPLHVALARRFFAVEGPDLKIVRADARRWVRAYRGALFDMVIDDLFGQRDGQPFRAVSFDQRWLEAISKLMADPGWLTVNFADRAELASSALRAGAGSESFVRRFRFSCTLSENAIVTCCGVEADIASFRRRLREHPLLQTIKAQRMLRFHLHQLT